MMIPKVPKKENHADLWNTTIKQNVPPCLQIKLNLNIS